MEKSKGVRIGKKRWWGCSIRFPLQNPKKAGVSALTNQNTCCDVNLPTDGKELVGNRRQTRHEPDAKR